MDGWTLQEKKAGQRMICDVELESRVHVGGRIVASTSQNKRPHVRVEGWTSYLIGWWGVVSWLRAFSLPEVATFFAASRLNLTMDFVYASIVSMYAMGLSVGLRGSMDEGFTLKRSGRVALASMTGTRRQ